MNPTAEWSPLFNLDDRNPEIELFFIWSQKNKFYYPFLQTLGDLCSWKGHKKLGILLHFLIMAVDLIIARAAEELYDMRQARHFLFGTGLLLLAPSNSHKEVGSAP